MGRIPMMSIQLLYSRQVPRTINCDPAMLTRSANAITNDEILAILSKIKSKHPIGNAVLDAQIALDVYAACELRSNIASNLKNNGIDEDIATALANVSVIEVCDSPACSRCKGTGVFMRAGEGLIECSKYHGVGSFVPSGRELHRMILSYLPESKRMSRDTFKRKWYDIYMSAVDTLHTEAGDAAAYAKEILRKIESENEYSEVG
eukprot:TRINITY_DN7188_c0_g1_i1.p1 TRINITY_DN7188_c0_g1~~TRINITY_DN7188_c0_g1_i1.p1  ORF type:complete len:205 (+),score=20.70 TRINITY_DN7188_c0_g1_i1:130-744(+)